ncbi:MAG: efflux RND transporter permease subunit [Proteobacteria bacterium]|nr:efflux RND transporter permease subunit [Pseudomonadota bacterium]MBU1687589.1 efflux RND transporter permease subunit [Pseudomonadota bacterium]
MNGPLDWMAKNHVAANLLMMVFIIGGLVLGPKIKQEVFPEISLDQVTVTVAYPGASPDEVEEGIILQIEEAISSIDGIDQINSTASEGAGTVSAKIRTGEDPDLVLQDIKAEVDRITTFPEDAEKPVVAKQVRRQEVISVVVSGDLSERTLREQAEAVRDDLLALPKITQAELSGVRPYEISIEIGENNLRRYNLTLDQVAGVIRRSSLDLPGGSIKAGGGEILVRTKEKRYTGVGYGDLPILVDGDGSTVYLREIAEIRDGFAETDEFARFDGMPAAMVKVFRVGDQKPTEISELVADYVASKGAELPESIRIGTWYDTSELFASRLHLLIKNAMFGLVMVFLVLTLFLQMRLALWVMLGIPISFLGALFLMPATDVSINMISLFAFIMALGIVVDDAIVIGENIFEHRQRGKSYAQAAIDGVREVAGPVVFSILTSVAAFVPLLTVSGTMGKFIKVIPMVVISILIISLVESLFILPAHLSLGEKNRDKNSHKPPSFFRARFGIFLDWLINRHYRGLLTLCIRYRYATVAAAIGMLLLSVGVVRGGLIRFNFMPVVDGDRITVSIEMPRGTLVEQTAQVQKKLLDAASVVVADYDQGRPEGDSILRHIYAVAGGTIAGSGPAPGGTSSAPHLASIVMLLQPSETRGVLAEDISRTWRELVGEIPGVDLLSFQSNLVHMGANIDVQFAHEDYTVLTRASERLKEVLAEYPGVEEISDNYPTGKKELKFRLTPEARTQGITQEDLARQLRSAYYGAEALRLQRGRNEVKVMVRYPENDRRRLWSLENMRIRTPQGGELPLARAAVVDEGRGFSVVNRTDRKRVLDVTASVDAKRANAEEILGDLEATILPELQADYPGLTYNLEGEAKERKDSMKSMGQGFLLALFVIYALLAIPFKSYSQPLLIMVAIPFGVVGAIIGHLVTGYDLSMLSLFGIVALSGVVVNDSLLLIDRINQSRREGEEAHEAILRAGQRRFRPILLTSLTTFFGLAPMILETSTQAQFLIPMAISLGFGILFATGITLLLIPVIYYVLEDFRNLLGLRPVHHR